MKACVEGLISPVEVCGGGGGGGGGGGVGGGGGGAGGKDIALSSVTVFKAANQKAPVILTLTFQSCTLAIYWYMLSHDINDISCHVDECP